MPPVIGARHPVGFPGGAAQRVARAFKIRGRGCERLAAARLVALKDKVAVILRRAHRIAITSIPIASESEPATTKHEIALIRRSRSSIESMMIPPERLVLAEQRRHGVEPLLP
jgi:hypothetical protein